MKMKVSLNRKSVPLMRQYDEKKEIVMRKKKKNALKKGEYSNIAMKKTAERAMEETEMFRKTQLYNALYRENDQNFTDRRCFNKLFHAFYQLCQDTYTESREDFIEFCKQNRHKFKFFQQFDEYWEDYDKIINHNLKKEIEREISEKFL